MRGVRLLIRLMRSSLTHQEHKKSADPHQAAESPWRFLVRKITLPYIDPFWVKAPCRLQRQIAGFGLRIAPDT